MVWLTIKLVPKWSPTCWCHNIVYIGSILTILVPFESPWSQLSIGTGIVKIGFLLTKLWAPKVNNEFKTKIMSKKYVRANLVSRLRFFLINRPFRLRFF